MYFSALAMDNKKGKYVKLCKTFQGFAKLSTRQVKAYKKINPEKTENSLTCSVSISKNFSGTEDIYRQLALHFPLRIFNVIANALIYH